MSEISEASCRPWWQGPSGQMAAKLIAQLTAQLVQLRAKLIARLAAQITAQVRDSSAGCKAKQRS